MTIMDRTRDQAGRDTAGGTGMERPAQSGGYARSEERQGQPINVGQNERLASVAAGGLLALLGLSRRSLPGLLIGGVGGVMIYRGVTGHCHTYQALGFDTAREDQEQDEDEITDRGVSVVQSMLVNRPAEQLYSFWRDFDNLARIMTHVQSVRRIDDRRSHWSVEPAKVMGRYEWDAEITREEPNSLIAWRSLPGGDLQTQGEVRFSKALGDRGTLVHVRIDYIPPVGQVGKWLANVFGKFPRRMIRDDLKRFKALMEVGEVISLRGQPHGTCTGRGKRYESE
ncbi:MAG TPA: SRPBCC family protein [Tepidisphaeraceae bacterium]|nr:SRPBCC family protein [Tepidisphaeraceae bacterium]